MNKIDRFEKEYDFLSNFYLAPIRYMDIVYKTTEHAYQAMKTLNPEHKNEIKLASTAGAAKKLGNKVNLRKDWEEMKDKIMFQVCLCKFLQHKDLAEKLLATGDAELEEGNHWDDRYWGTVNGEGENKLGKILMKVRSIIKGEI
jgi:hypothetical protein